MTSFSSTASGVRSVSPRPGNACSRSRDGFSIRSSRRSNSCRNRARCGRDICASWPMRPIICLASSLPFAKKHPGVRVTIRAGNTESVVAGLRSYDADVGVLGEVPAGGEFDVVELNSTPIIAFASKGHSGRPAAQHELCPNCWTIRWSCGREGSKTRKKLEEGAALAGVTLPPSVEAEGREAVREIVASGAGIGFVSRAEFGATTRGSLPSRSRPGHADGRGHDLP